jgi:two-component system NarL family response regulator
MSIVMDQQRCMSFEVCRIREIILGHLFVHTLDAVLICTLEGTIVDANPSASAMLGYDREKILQMQPWEIIAEVSRKELLSQWQQLDCGVPVEKERIYRRKSGIFAVAERLIRLSPPQEGLVILMFKEKPQGKRIGINLGNAVRNDHSGEEFIFPFCSPSFEEANTAEQKLGISQIPRQEAASPAKIRILISDQQALVREGLASMIARQEDMVVVAEARHGNETVELWNRHAPDVTLVDLHLPELDGMGVIKKIRARNASARIIVLTTSDGAGSIYRAIQAGAKAYMLKDTCREELMTCIRNVHRGESFVTQSIAAKLAEYMTAEELTGREAEVLCSIAAGISNKEIARKLFISQTTVKTHVRNIFGKLGVKSRTEATAVATRRGLLQP